MDGVTDHPCRLMMAKIGHPDLMYTEFVAVEGLAAGALRLLDDLRFSPEEQPLIAQFFGTDPGAFYQAAVIAGYLGFSGVDINMGCPAKDVAARGAGAGLIKTPELASQIIRQTESGIRDFSQGITAQEAGLAPKLIARLPEPTDRRRLGLSVKTRLGVVEDTSESWITHLAQTGVEQITLHGRTLKQMYGGVADWDAIALAKRRLSQFPVRLFGNGDLQSRAEALAKIELYQLDGALIGRAAIGNPWAFIDTVPSYKARIETAIMHAKLHSTLKSDAQFGSMRKHLFDYTKGFPGAKHVRLQLNDIHCLEDVERILNDKQILNPVE